MYKGLLQNYAQRRGLGMPAYDNESMGMDQATCFKASVTVGGQTFKSPQFFSLLKDAEHAAAKVAMEFFLPEGNLEAMLLSEEGRFYKNLLCEMTQKEGLALPVYDTVSDGPSHMPTFASRVEIEGERFQGSVMKTKKQAEDDAAKVAWTRLRERKLSRFSSRFQVIKINDVSPSLPPPLPPRGVIKMIPSQVTCFLSIPMRNMQSPQSGQPSKRVSFDHMVSSAPVREGIATSFFN
ncbi:unnamed protein product [Spirodela intermedia]|uniref:DRBM domain-containing protein n=1 Tax=Spirodela intermedia TaxID=51605 RepID=A0A7I8I8B1_SPIIN|nr:unnamed protein product [Spirodela intermedia]CAA6653849.1 unnamed protein product [Spirodela intermedia]